MYGQKYFHEKNTDKLEEMTLIFIVTSQSYSSGLWSHQDWQKQENENSCIYIRKEQEENKSRIFEMKTNSRKD